MYSSRNYSKKNTFNDEIQLDNKPTDSGGKEKYYRVGDRIRLIHTNDRYTKLVNGDLGTITAIDRLPAEIGGTTQLIMEWDNGSRLFMLVDIDEFEVVGHTKPRWK